MPLSDLVFPLTGKKIGPSATVLSRPKVHYLRSSDLVDFNPDTVRAGTILTVLTKGGEKKVEIYETPNEFSAAQALAQGATGNIYAAIYYTATGATGSSPAAAQPLTNYINNINSGAGGLLVSLPDPFVRRLVVILNTSTGSIGVVGRNATAYINGATAAVVLLPGQRKHFLAPTQGTASSAGQVNQWKTAIDV